MTEPDVALTDYGLALECAVLCVLVARSRTSGDSLRSWWIVFFASIGLGSLLGGTVHGFYHATNTTGYAILWPATLLTIGVTSVATWMVAAHLQPQERARLWVRRGAIGLLVLYACVVLFVSRAFLVAIVAYLPATLFLLVAMITAYRRRRERPLAYGVLGLVLTFLAATVQQLHVTIHPVYFNHNALYHVMQGVALLLIFLAAKATSTSPTDSQA